MSSPLVQLQRHGPVVVLSLQRPERHNALIPELLEDLLAALSAPDCRSAGALVLRAEGRSFSTGGDVLGFQQQRHNIETYANRLVGMLNDAILAIYTLPLPTVCAINGTLTGGALGLALACDRVVMHAQASITPWYNTVGFSPDGGWTALLPGIIGRQQAAHWLHTNASHDAATCQQLGLVHEVVNSDCDAAALAWAQRSAGRQADSNSATCRLLRGDAEGLRRGLEAEREAFVRQIQTAQAQAGIDEFLRSKSV